MAKRIQHDARLNTRALAVHIDMQDLVIVLAHVHHDGHVAALTRQARPAAAREQWCAKLAAGSDRSNHIFLTFRDDHADGGLPVVGSVRGVKRAGTVVKTYLAFQLFPESLREPLGVDVFTAALNKGFVRYSEGRF